MSTSGRSQDTMTEIGPRLPSGTRIRICPDITSPGSWPTAAEIRKWRGEEDATTEDADGRPKTSSDEKEPDQ